MLYFSHGFGITYNEKIGIVPPENTRCCRLVAPKGSGITVRSHFVNLAESMHLMQFTKIIPAVQKTDAFLLHFSILDGHAFETTFKKEVFSDLTGERSVLIGSDSRSIFCPISGFKRKRTQSL